MKEQLISFKTAKLAKEKSFPHINKGLNYMYTPKGRLYNSVGPTFDEQDSFQAPTQPLLKQWLREKHNIDVSVTPYGELEIYEDNPPLIKTYQCRVDNWNTHWSVHDGTGLVMPEHYHFHNQKYEKALEKGLYKALKLIS